MLATLAFLKTPVGRYLVGAVLTLMAVWAFYAYAKGKGYAECKADWTAAERATIEKSNTDRRDAERAVRDGVRDPRDRDDN